MSYPFWKFGPVAGDVLKANALRLDKAFAEGLRPPPRMDVSAWAASYRRFPDDAPIGGAWRHETAPELVEIMDALSPHDACEEVTLMKCAQSGGSASAENWLGYISDLAPGPVLFVQATYQAALDWAAEKFWPMVDATPRLSPDRFGTIRAQGLAQGDGSTTKKILFARSSGYILLAGANSAAGLRQRTVRYAVEDDLDQFPADLDGQGSPEGMIDERLKVWRSRGQSKRIKISTPTIKGSSKIEAAYRVQGGDPRRYYFLCPSCSDWFVPDWADIRWPDGAPQEAHLVAPCCGSVLEHWQKSGMKLAEGWLSAVIAGETIARILSDREFQRLRLAMPQSVKRGFHLPGEISSFQSWAEMATSFCAALGDVNKLKTWTNLKRGIPFELKGDTPDYEALKSLREQDWGTGQMPIGPVAVTLGCDVQGDGIYAELVGWWRNKENWQLDARFIPGSTDVAGEGAWAALDVYSKRGVTFPGGLVFPIDQECVDAGYHTDAARAYCSKRPRRLAVFGRAGWGRPTLGRGEAVAFERQGRRTGAASRKSEDKAYLVGVNGVKLSWYGFLRATLKAVEEAIEQGGDVKAPLGRIHLGRDVPEDWFEQVTAESIVVKMVNGFPDRRWVPMPGRQNHYLDCRVYNFAAAEKLMLDTLSDADWAAQMAERYAPVDEKQGDLLVPSLAAPSAAGPAAPTDKRWIDQRDDYL
jgi:phage terminase large subunit GpA-like protein